MELEVYKRHNHEQCYISVKGEGPYMDSLMVRKLKISMEDYYKILENNNLQYDYNNKGEKFSYFKSREDTEKAIDELNGLLIMSKLTE